MSDYVIKQLSVFMENKPGRLTEITEALGKDGINIRGFSVADMADYGIFRLIVADADKAKKVLDDLGFTAKESDVICVNVPDKPGGLAGILKVFSEHEISVEYMYVIADTKIAFSVENIDKAVEALTGAGMPLLSQADISAL
ncbi:MAG: ACT domain-containing protein [Actinomycetota bacterium]